MLYKWINVGKKLVEKETSFNHILVARKTVEDYDLPLSYYVDEHSIFRFVKHKGIHVTYTVGEDEGKNRLKPLSEEIELDYVFSLHYKEKSKKRRRDNHRSMI